MARLMSVALTTDQVRRHAKTVTRRIGWRMIKPGDQLTLCPKVRGRRTGEPLERIVTVEVVSVRREPLSAITQADVAAEGFPELTPAEFVEFFCTTHRGVEADSEITRIEWAYPRRDPHPTQADLDAALSIYSRFRESQERSARLSAKGPGYDDTGCHP